MILQTRQSLNKYGTLLNKHIKSGEFDKLVENFKIDNITYAQVQKVNMIMKHHSDMNFNLIMSLSRVAAFMFEWTKLAIKHTEVRIKIHHLGVKQIEDKIAILTHNKSIYPFPLKYCCTF